MKYKTWRLMQIFLTLFAPNFQSKKWESRVLEDAQTEYFNLLEDPRNEFLWERIEPLSCVNVLEIGSNCGPKLQGLATRNPNMFFNGWDINSHAVELGQAEADRRNLENIKFKKINISESSFAALDYSFELVFTWATLIYVHPIHITRVLKNILSFRPTCIILIEQDSPRLRKFFKYGKLIGGGPNWVRDYEYLLKKIVGSSAHIEFIRKSVPLEIWSPGGGSASMLIIKLRQEAKD